MFKIDKTEQSQLDNKIKIVKSDWSGDYYRRYYKLIMGPSVRYLPGCGIVTHYNMPGTLEKNGPAERQN